MRLSLFLSILGLNFACGFSSSNMVPTISTTARAPFLFRQRSAAPPASAPTSSSARWMMPARGGAMSSSSSSRAATIANGGSSKNCPMRGVTQLVASLYGTTGVIYILMKAITRVMPIALEPFTSTATPLTTIQWGAYLLTCLWFGYVEGYKGFQTKFTPLVVSRSLTLEPGYSRWHHYLLAPLYSMGLFHATRKRLMVSWGVTLGVAGIVRAVKQLPYPYRNIVDAGVVVGLSYGAISIVVQYVRAVVFQKGGPNETDPALPKQ